MWTKGAVTFGMNDEPASWSEQKLDSIFYVVLYNDYT